MSAVQARKLLLQPPPKADEAAWERFALPITHKTLTLTPTLTPTRTRTRTLTGGASCLLEHVRAHTGRRGRPCAVGGAAEGHSGFTRSARTTGDRVRVRVTVRV